MENENYQLALTTASNHYPRVWKVEPGLGVRVGWAAVAFACELMIPPFAWNLAIALTGGPGIPATEGPRITSRFHTLRSRTAAGILALGLETLDLAKIIL